MFIDLVLGLNTEKSGNRLLENLLELDPLELLGDFVLVYTNLPKECIEGLIKRLSDTGFFRKIEVLPKTEPLKNALTHSSLKNHSGVYWEDSVVLVPGTLNEFYRSFAHKIGAGFMSAKLRDETLGSWDDIYDPKVFTPANNANGIIPVDTVSKKFFAYNAETVTDDLGLGARKLGYRNYLNTIAGVREVNYAKDNNTERSSGLGKKFMG